jgi:selenophosphate synthetase-related protein
LQAALSNAATCTTIVYAARDISNAGILGSLLMLLEATQSGADDLNKIPNHKMWTGRRGLNFPSYGFLLTADEGECEDIIELFDSQGIAVQ